MRHPALNTGIQPFKADFSTCVITAHLGVATLKSQAVAFAQQAMMRGDAPTQKRDARADRGDLSFIFMQGQAQGCQGFNEFRYAEWCSSALLSEKAEKIIDSNRPCTLTHA